MEPDDAADRSPRLVDVERRTYGPDDAAGLLVDGQRLGGDYPPPGEAGSGRP